MRVCYTFDIEEHDRIEAAAGYDCPAYLRADYARRMESCTRWLLEVLDQSGTKATFFVVGHIAVSHPQLIREMTAQGHEVGCHNWDHRSVQRYAPHEYRADIRRAKEELEQAAGQRVVGYRAPTFSITRATGWAIDILSEEGFRYDSSVFPVQHDRYGVPDAPRMPFRAGGMYHTLLELPPATCALHTFNLPAAGGGYFRLFPAFVMHAAVRQLTRQQDGVPVLYFHPWEFDATQPRLPIGRLGRFRTYVGIHRTRARLKKLLARYPGRTMLDAATELERSNSPLATYALVATAANTR